VISTWSTPLARQPVNPVDFQTDPLPGAGEEKITKVVAGLNSIRHDPPATRFHSRGEAAR
jgi:hypothetical protein